MLLAQPAIEYERVIQKNEKIIVLDASASMMLTDGNATRFERAVEQIKDYAEIVIGEGGEVTVILAGSKSDFRRITGRSEKNNGHASRDNYGGSRWSTGWKK